MSAQGTALAVACLGIVAIVLVWVSAGKDTGDWAEDLGSMAKLVFVTACVAVTTVTAVAVILFVGVIV